MWFWAMSELDMLPRLWGSYDLIFSKKMLVISINVIYQAVCCSKWDEVIWPWNSFDYHNKKGFSSALRLYTLLSVYSQHQKSVHLDTCNKMFCDHCTPLFVEQVRFISLQKWRCQCFQNVHLLSKIRKIVSLFCMKMHLYIQKSYSPLINILKMCKLSFFKATQVLSKMPLLLDRFI